MERRKFLELGAGLAVGSIGAATVARAAGTQLAQNADSKPSEALDAGSVRTSTPATNRSGHKVDGTPFIAARSGNQIYVKDWGPSDGPPVVLIHGWPLSADHLDRLAMHLAMAGHRVINYDRRGMGRSSQPWAKYDWDTLSDDLADVMQATGVMEDVTVIGYSMGGGEAARYMSRYNGKGVIKIGLFASVTPGVLKSDDNPNGMPGSTYDDISKGIQGDKAGFFRHKFLPPFYGVGGPHTASVDTLEAGVTTALSAGMKPLIDMAHSFTFGDFKDDMPAITVPTLILHGTADKDLPVKATAERAHAMIPSSKLIKYEGHPHAFYATNSDQMISDTLEFMKQ